MEKHRRGIPRSEAIALIDEVQDLRRISSSLATRLRAECSAFVKSRGIERARSKILRYHQNDVLGARIAVEHIRGTLMSERTELEGLDAEHDLVLQQLDEHKQRETANMFEQTELGHVHNDLLQHAIELRKKNDSMVQPEIINLKNRLLTSQRTLKRTEELFDRDFHRKQLLMDRSRALSRAAAEVSSELNQVQQKASVEPDRVRKQAECVQKASDKLCHEILKVETSNRILEQALNQRVTKRREAEAVRHNLVRKLELHQDTIIHRNRDYILLKKNVEIEKSRAAQLFQSTLRLVISRDQADEQVQRGSDWLGVSRKEAEALRRHLRKKQSLADLAKDLVPTLRTQLSDCGHLLLSHVTENTRNQSLLGEFKKRASFVIAGLLRNEGSEKVERKGLENILRDVANLEDEIANWSAEERRQTKLVTIVNAQSELKAREATRARLSGRETKQHLKVKGLVLIDLTKKNNELHNKSREFAALYDVVKNERNKYVCLIVSSSQAYAEMKEKIKILNNEVEILRIESSIKDRALSKEHAQRLSSLAHRDGLRLDLHNAQSDYQKKQEVVEQQTVEIYKLNSIIGTLETNMLWCQSSYEDTVEKRNAIGVTVIDRNDELCILYEKVNLQENILLKGEREIRQKQGDVQTLRLQLVETQGHLTRRRKWIKKAPDLAKSVFNLQTSLRSYQHTSSSMCIELESPSNLERWRFLPGADSDECQLAHRIVLLEETSSIAKKRHLESELVMEEISALIVKLRGVASNQHAFMSAFLRCVNNCKASIHQETKMKRALMAELSMFQATTMNLKCQYEAVVLARERARCFAANDEPPTEKIVLELYQRKARLFERRDRSSFLAASLVLRTTAKPRPNAYVSDACLSLPKPYSSLAPFKPAVRGAAMRHLRPPLASNVLL